MSGARRSDVLSAFTAIVVFTPAVAQAYIDPGFGALMWQAGVAAFAGSIFFFRRTLGSFVSRIRGKRGEASDATPPVDPEIG